MISRRRLMAAGGAAAVGAAGVLALASAPGRASRGAPERAPDFAVAGLDGAGRYRLGDFAGQVLLVNFWATWCAPCRMEMPWLARTYLGHRAQGLAILGINMDDGDMPAVRRFAHEMGVTYPLARSDDAVVAAYGGVRFLPQSFLIGRHGEVLERAFGMPSTGELEAEMMTALSRS